MNGTLKNAVSALLLVLLIPSTDLCSAEVQLLNATLEWSFPAQRANGDLMSVSEIGGYRIRYRATTKATFEEVTVPDGAATKYVVEGLLPGKYEFMIAAYDRDKSTGKYSAPFYVCLVTDTSKSACSQENLEGSVVWEQSFSSGSKGLSKLPKHLNVKKGVLSVRRMTGWETSRFAVHGKRTYSYNDYMTFKAQISAKSWSKSGELGFGAMNTTSIRENMRFHSVFLENGGLHIRANNVYGYDQVTSLGPAERNTTYQVEMEFTKKGTTLYVYPVGKTREDGYSNSQKYIDWGDTQLVLYTNQLGINGTVDNLQELSPSP